MAATVLLHVGQLNVFHNEEPPWKLTQKVALTSNLVKNT
jgi:hypothetical protein